MLQVDIPAAVRTTFGKGESRRLRMSNKTPAVMYGTGNSAVSLQFDTAMLNKNLFEIHGRNAVITLNIEGDGAGKHHVLVKDMQKDPVTDNPIHIDFQEIALDRALEFQVPLKYVGTAKGVDLGGDLHIFKHQVRLKGCPLDIPDTITIDVTPLERGATGFTYGDLAVPENVEVLDKKDAVCVSVS